jgi:catechol 2,3-dioxygenase-like lactoylglutathione lyase family enzyme
MAKMHVSLNVANVERSVEFYRLFFGVEPVKLKSDYAKFDLAEPAVNLTMNQVEPEGPAERGHLSHMGIQVEGHAAVDTARKRLEAAGMIALDEQDTVCCYARQDKVWATDPDGNRWEIFFVMDADVDAASFESASCCVPVDQTEDEACCTPETKKEAVATGKGCC